MGLFGNLFGKRKDNCEDDDLTYEEYCENCGELLEDCECDEQDFSKEDISQEEYDYEFEEMVDQLEYQQMIDRLYGKDKNN